MSVARDPERGSAVIEFVFVAVLVLVPLIYLIVAVATVQRAQLGVVNAAREAGRAFATATTADQGMVRARAAAQAAFDDAGLPGTPELRWVTGPDCGSAAIAPTLRAGAVFTVCVTRATPLPAVPTIAQGRGIHTDAAYVVHVDDYRGL